MVSRIVESRPYEFVSIEHLGIIQDGIEDTTSETARKWTPAYENYSFEPKGTETTLTIDMDMEDAHVEIFRKMWEDGLDRLKTIAEKAAADQR